MTTNDVRERLTDEMDRRRIALRMQWGEVATAADMSTAHLRRIRTDPQTAITPLMAAGLESALQWPAGTIGRILAGEVAESVESQAEPNPYTDPAERHIWETPDTTASERRLMIGVLQTARSMDAAEESTPAAEVRTFRRRG